MRTRCIGLDVGERRVGVAISDPTGIIARPLQALPRTSLEDDLEAIAALVAEHEVGLVVVGRPLSLDGSEGPQARRVNRYTKELTERLPVPVTTWDERFSTVMADDILRQTRKEKAKRRARANGEIDAIAAAVILQNYLDSQEFERNG